MPEMVTKKEIAEKPDLLEVLPTAPATQKPKPAEIEFDEADALFKKRADP